MDGTLGRIINGYLFKKIGNKRLKIYYPSKEIAYEGSLIYEEIVNGEGYSSVSLAIKSGLWSARYESELEKTEEEIERLKQQLYESFFNSQAVKIRSELNESKEKLNQLYSRRNALDAYSIQSVAEYSRLAFFMENCTFFEGELYNWDEWSIRSAVYYWLQNTIPETKIRELARCDEWQSIICSSKNFNTPLFPSSIDMNQDQNRLVSWTSIYQNIRQLEDCPHEDIFEDDDAFDGFLIKKRKERKSDSEKVKTDKTISSKVGRHQEVFIFPTKDRNLNDVHNLVSKSNSPQAEAIRKQRFDFIKKNKSVKHGALPDVKMEMKMQANRAESRKK